MSVINVTVTTAFVLSPSEGETKPVIPNTLKVGQTVTGTLPKVKSNLNLGQNVLTNNKIKKVATNVLLSSVAKTDRKQQTYANKLVFSHAILTTGSVLQKPKPVKTSVRLSQHVLSNKVYGRTVHTNVQFKQSNPNYRLTTCDVQDVYVNGPALINTHTVTFEFPYTSPSIRVTLPSPEFSNKDELNLRRISRTTRGLTRKIVRQTTWPKFKTFNVRFISIHKNRVEEFRVLLRQSLGQYIKYTDYEGRVWKCLVTNPSMPASDENKDCGYTLDLTLEVVLT